MRTHEIALGLIVLAACGGGDGPSSPDGVASVVLNAPSLAMLVGKSDQLTATAMFPTAYSSTRSQPMTHAVSSPMVT